MKWWLDEFCAGDQVDHYVELFPELDSRLAKYAVGIFIWNMSGLIDINNPDDVGRVRQILKVLDQTPGYDFFDNVFNEAGPNVVSGIIGLSPMIPVEEGIIKYDYTVTEVKDFNYAHLYFEIVSWNIVISEQSFNECTKNGNRFFFCCNDDWDVPCQQGVGFPWDRFGYSLIAVKVSPENEIVSIVSRWNTYAGDNGKFITEEELKSILGTEKYNKLFYKP